MSLPPIPNSWNNLSWPQLLHVWSIIALYPGDDNRIKRTLQIYAYLTKVSFRKAEDYELPEGMLGKECYLITRTDKKHKGETGVVEIKSFMMYLLGFHPEKKEGAPQIDEIHGVMDWLLHPEQLISFPIEYIKIRGRKFSLPSPIMTSITYQQYGNMQKILEAYWNTIGQIQKKEEEIRSKMIDTSSGLFDKKAVEIITNDIEGLASQIIELNKTSSKLRAQFLAHALNGRKFQISTRSSGSTQLAIGWAYTYSVESAEANISIMKHASDSVFYIVQQYFQGCINYYKNEMPDLFTASGKMDARSPIMSEIDTINAIMKWKGAYTNQQEVYDANAIFVLGDLKDMTKEAKEIEKANAKMHTHK